MKRSGPLKRTKGLAQSKPLKRTELKRDPTYRMPQRSPKRERLEQARREVRAEVLRRAGAADPGDLSACQYRVIIPEVACSWLPDRRQLEVDELRGGSHRSTEWLDPDQCRATCPFHHDIKTTHKREVLRRLAEHEERAHGVDERRGGEPS